MIETDLQSTFYGELEYVMGALQGINDTNAILRIIVELLANEFGATCVAWQVDEPRWRMAAIMPQSVAEPVIAFQEIDFSSKQLTRINGMLVAPLCIDMLPWGALAIDEGAIEGERLSFLQTVAYHLEVALSTAESFNKQLLLAKESAELCDAGRTLLGFTRMEPLAQAISRLAVNLANADEAALYVATDNNFARVGCAPYETATVHVDIEHLQWARENGRCYSSNDDHSIVVPLHEAGEFISARFAALVVSRFASSDCFTANHTRKLEAFGALCAMALRNVRLYEEASEANLALSDINAFKDDLLAMFTHDFKGPLTVISGYGELVLEKLEGDERENLGIILRQVKRLATLADDALALARAQAAGFVLQLEHGELVAFVADVLRSSLGTQAHRIITKLHVPSVMLAFDPIAMRHVLENILGNALKYSSLSITLEIDIDGNDAVIAVRDSGIGIPAEELPNVFGRFARASNARRRGISGSGVGLYLAKRLIEQHRGSISVASIEGEGSTFEIRLPIN
jgi:signal transduction histidine kinase